MASECTERAVLEFLTERGGRVKQMELIDHFESIWKNDSSLETMDRETLRRTVDGVAVETLENGVKFVRLKQEVEDEEEEEEEVDEEEEEECVDSVMMGGRGRDEEEECNGNGVSAAACSPLSVTTADPGENINNKGSSSSSSSDNYVNGNPDASLDKDTDTAGLDNDAQSNGNERPRSIEEEEEEAPTEATTAGTPSTGGGGGEVKLRERKRRESAPAIGTELELHHHHLHHHHLLHHHHHGQVVRGGRRVSRGSQRALLSGGGLSEDSACMEGLGQDPGAGGDGSTPKGSRRNFIELMMSSSPQVRRSLINRGGSSRLRDSVRSADSDSGSLLSSSATDEDCASVALDPLEHEWMLCASDGLWDSLGPLLALEPGLVAKRDFVTGFSCLHWAAKQGKAELLSRLLAFAGGNAVHVDVNARSGAGYTPLHLAAMHGHTQVVRVLLSDWEADPEVRDYSGRRAIQYLPAPLVANLQDEGVVTSPGSESDTESAEGGSGTGGRGAGWGWRRVLRLLNPPAAEEAPAAGGGDGGNGTTKAKAVGIERKSSLSRLNARLHRGRHRAHIIHSTSFRESGEVERGDGLPTCSPMRTRPLSNLFG